MKTDLHKLCLDIISKITPSIKNIIKRCNNEATYSYTIVDEHNNEEILSVICVHSPLTHSCSYSIFLYNSAIFLTAELSEQIFSKLEKAYSLAMDKLTEELNALEEKQLKENIKKAQAFLLK